MALTGAACQLTCQNCWRTALHLRGSLALQCESWLPFNALTAAAAAAAWSPWGSVACARASTSGPSLPFDFRSDSAAPLSNCYPCHGADSCCFWLPSLRSLLSSPVLLTTPHTPSPPPSRSLGRGKPSLQQSVQLRAVQQQQQQQQQQQCTLLLERDSAVGSSPIGHLAAASKAAAEPVAKPCSGAIAAAQCILLQGRVSGLGLAAQGHLAAALKTAAEPVAEQQQQQQQIQIRGSRAAA
ncbi:hypothetical protein CLOP_g11398 [Closterium sp. NIES-67]|nr:hypothetical protein CLOP_g11398 [Closterium sp. NIES-67]